MLNYIDTIDGLKNGSTVLLKKGEDGFESFQITKLDGTHLMNFSDKSVDYSLRKQLKSIPEEIEQLSAKYIEGEGFDIQFFFPFGVKSKFSILNGSSQIGEIIERYPSGAALADDNLLSGSVELTSGYLANGGQSIIGFNVAIANDTSEALAQEKSGSIDKITMFALNEDGYKKLSLLSSLASKNGLKGNTLNYLSFEDLAEGSLNEDVLCVLSIAHSSFNDAVTVEDADASREIVESFVNIFGKNTVIGVEKHVIAKSYDQIIDDLISLADEFEITAMAFLNSTYTNKNDLVKNQLLRSIELQIPLNQFINDPDFVNFNLEGVNHHMMSSQEMTTAFKRYPELLFNSLIVAQRFNQHSLIFPEHPFMPSFGFPDGFESEDEYFTHLIWKGTEERYGKSYSDEVKDRVTHELEVIREMGFIGYFLIVQDYMKEAIKQNIPVGAGRGSAAGSIVAYVLYITEIDPIKYGLLFERFLNKERYDMPDVDSDFSNKGRRKIIQYASERWGERAVTYITTFTVLAGKQVLRDVSKSLDLGVEFGEMMSDSLPEKAKSLADAMTREDFLEYQEFINSNSDAKKTVDNALLIEGCLRQTGVHASGILIGPDDIVKFMPTYFSTDKEGNVIEIAQFNMSECERVGILKMDFLGLKTLSIIEDTLDMIPEEEKMDLMSDIPIDDHESYFSIRDGFTSAVFQLESPGMTAFMKKLFQDISLSTDKEELFARLAAGISIFRPGPMDEADNFIYSMLHQDKIIYEIPEIKHILEETYGIIVYQEQVMFIVQALASFTMGQADIIRKAMGKKKVSLIDEYGKYFINGAGEEGVDSSGLNISNINGSIANGIDEEKSLELWDKMAKFALYAFNKSHAICYAYLAAKTAYLATHYPTEFLTAVANNNFEEHDKLQGYLDKFSTRDVEIIPPSINTSNEKFTIRGFKQIEFGLKGIKGAGTAGKIIEAERNENGVFESYTDAVYRLRKDQRMKSSQLEALIHTGTFDVFGTNRAEYLVNIQDIFQIADYILERGKSGRTTIFEADLLGINPMSNFKMKTANPMSLKSKLEIEKKLTGVYLSEHPLDHYKELLKKEKVSSISKIVEKLESGSALNKKKYTFAGILKDSRELRTKADGDLMYSYTLAGKSSEINCISFPGSFEKFHNFLKDKKKEHLVLISGTPQMNGDYGPQIIVEDILPLETIELSTVPSQCIYTIPDVGLKKSRKLFKQARKFAEKLNSETDFESAPRLDLFVVYDGDRYSAGQLPYSLEILSDLQNIFGNFNLEYIFDK